MNMGGAEAVIFLVAWVIPLGAIVFALTALWQILRGMGQITTELIRIREVLERDRPG